MKVGDVRILAILGCPLAIVRVVSDRIVDPESVSPRVGVKILKLFTPSSDMAEGDVLRTTDELLDDPEDTTSGLSEAVVEAARVFYRDPSDTTHDEHLEIPE